jgi:hypothetical protein
VKRKYIYVLLLLFLFGCQQSFKLSDNVNEVLNKSGDNRIELEKVIKHYQNPKDSLKLKAALFLIGNMGQQSFLH